MSFVFKLWLEDACLERNQKHLGVILNCYEGGVILISVVSFVPHSSAFVFSKYAYKESL